jgi:outer membrane protein TolC
MKKSFGTLIILIGLFFLWTPSLAQENIHLSLEEIVERAKSRSPAALRAETQKENSYWSYRFFRSNYNPQLRLGGNIPGFSQSVTNVVQPDGSVGFKEVRQNLMDLELGMEQVIGATGGNISINSSTSRFDNFLVPLGVPQTQWSGVPVNVRFSQPLFAYNPLKWDKKIEPLLFEESKREYVQEMEQIALTVTQLFFDFLIAQVNFEIASKNLNNTQEILKIEKGRYNLGTTYEDKLLQVELQVLQAKQDLAQARLDQETNALRLKSYVGINESAELTLILPNEVPKLEIDVEVAIDYAFQNRAEALGFDRRRLEAESGVAQARGERFNVLLNASYGLNNAALQWRDIYTDPNRQTLVNLGFFVPILDWGRFKARMGVAEANKRLIEYTVEQEIINFEQEIFTKVKNFSLLRERLEITQLSDAVADKRYEISLQRYQNGNLSITDLNIAQEEKDKNRRAYIQSLREFWTSFFEIRQLTLFDFENNRLLYNPAPIQ